MKLSSKPLSWRKAPALPHPPERKSAKRGVRRPNHFRDFDPRWTTPIPKGTDVVSLLKSQGAGDRCYVLSDSEAIDRQVMSLESAVKAAKASPWGTSLDVSPGRWPTIEVRMGNRSYCCFERASSPNRPPASRAAADRALRYTHLACG